MNKSLNSEKLAISNAIFSLKMEGCVVDNKTKKLCEKYLRDEITFEEYMEEIKAKLGLKA